MYQLSKTTPDFKKSGVYQIIFPNNKSYIGISNNIRDRLLEHNRSINRYNYPIYNAIKKYGPIENFEILEEIPKENRKLMGEREQYWINYYDTTNEENGYNLSIGGDGLHLLGTKSPRAKLNDKEIKEVINLIIFSEKTFTEIAELYNIDLSCITDINTGESYYYQEYNYPLRSEEEKERIRMKNQRKIDSAIEEKVRKELKESKLTFKQIADKYQIDHRLISDINNGYKYKSKNYTYPIRSKEDIKNISYKEKVFHNEISEEIILKIIDILLNTSYSYSEIKEKYGYNRTILTNVNLGLLKNSPKNIKYPIRGKEENNKLSRGVRNPCSKISSNDLEQIIYLLQNTNESYSKIGKKYNMSGTAIGNINKGKTYKNDQIDYPIRKK